MSTAISARTPSVSVEYDSNGKRATKKFPANHAHDAKRFYAQKMKAGKSPSVKGDGAPFVTGTKKPATKAHSESTRDALGCRVGSQAAKINAALSSKKPKLLEKIAEETGLPTNRVNAHLHAMLRKKKVERTERGFAVV